MGPPYIYDCTECEMKELRNKTNLDVMSSLDDAQSRHHVPCTLLCPMVATD